MKKIFKVKNGYSRKYSIILLDDKKAYTKTIKDRISFYGSWNGDEYYPTRTIPDISEYSSIVLENPQLTGHAPNEYEEFKAPMSAVQKIIPEYEEDKLTEIAIVYTEEETGKFLFFTYKTKKYKIFSLVGEDLEKFVSTHKLINTPEEIASGDFEEKYDEQELLNFIENLESGKTKIYF